MTCNATAIGKKIRTYSKAVEAATSLDILRAVETTVDSLVREQRMLNAFLSLASDAIEYVKSCDGNRPLDEDDTISSSLEDAEKALRELYADFEIRIKSAQDDHELNDDHEDAVVSEYSRALFLLERLHDATIELRWAVMEHDADLDKVTGRFDNTDDLITHLDSL